MKQTRIFFTSPCLASVSDQMVSENIKSTNQTKLASIIWLAFILAIFFYNLHGYWPVVTSYLNDDASHTYLPNARGVIQHGWHFFTTDPKSYHVAPLTYIWFAILGADPTAIRMANCALFILCILLLWRIAFLAGGLIAGMAATLLFSIHPRIWTAMPDVLSEPLFLFGLFLSLHALAVLCLKKDHRNRIFFLAATGLTITLLTRPVFQYVTIASAALLVALMASVKKDTPVQKAVQSIAKKTLLTLVAACLIPAAVIIKNGIFFDVWGISTGTGTALYYGTHPLKMGIEPIYMGYSYDAGRIADLATGDGSKNPFSPQADQALRAAAINTVLHTEAADNMRFFLSKAHSWVRYNIYDALIQRALRTYRTFELISIIVAALLIAPHIRKISRNRLLFFSTVAAITILMVVQFAPILYNIRYNALMLEPFFILFCGLALSTIYQALSFNNLSSRISSQSRIIFLRLAVFFCIIALIYSVSHNLTSRAIRSETFQTDPYRPGPTQTLIGNQNLQNPHFEGGDQASEMAWKANQWNSTLIIPFQPPQGTKLSELDFLDGLWRIRMSVSSPTKKNCRRALIKLTNHQNGETALEPMIAIQSDGTMRTYVIHGNTKLRPAGDGELHIQFSCPPGTIINWGSAEFLRSTMPEAAEDFFRQGTPIKPYLHREP